MCAIDSDETRSDEEEVKVHGKMTKKQDVRVVAIDDTMDDRDIASWDFEDTDLANVDGLLGVTQEQDISSCECGFHTFTRKW